MAKKKVKKKVKKKKAAKKAAARPRVVIYTTPTCPYCRLAKQFLDKYKIKYVSKDVSKDRKLAEEMIEKSGQMGVPVIIIGGTIIVGYDEEAMKQALKLK